MARVAFDITDKSHPDHMPAETLRVILELCRDGVATVVVPPSAGIFIAKIKLPEHLPDLKNALRGPASGEPPVGALVFDELTGRVTGDDPAFYGVRDGRPCLSRLVNTPSTPTRYATVIVGALEEQDGGSFKGTLFTAYGDNAPSDFGVIAPQEPGDPFAPVETLEERVKFWSEHALSADSPIPFREAVADFEDFADLNRSQVYATAVNNKPAE